MEGGFSIGKSLRNMKNAKYLLDFIVGRLLLILVGISLVENWRWKLGCSELKSKINVVCVFCFLI